jgi:hypothetical protein
MFLAVGLLVLAGHGLLRVLIGKWPLGYFGVLGAVGMSWLCGVALIGLLTTWIAVLGLSVRPFPFLVPLLILLAVAGVLPAGTAERARISRDPSPCAVPPSPRWGDIVAAFALIPAALALLPGIRRVIVVSNDEYAIWAIRGRMLSLTGHLDPHVFEPALSNYQHLDYPLLVPALIAWADGIAGGRIADGTAHLLLVLTLLAMLAVLGWAVNRIGGPLAGATAALLVTGAPALMWHNAYLLLADVPLLDFVLPAVVVLGLWLLWRDSRLLVVTVVLAAAAASTKVEGMLFAGAAFVAAIVFAPPGLHQRRRPAIGLGAVVLCALPWLAWTKVHHIQSDLINSTTLNVHHLRLVFPYSGLVVRQIVRFWPAYGWAGLLGAVLAAACALATRRVMRLVGFVGLTAGLIVVGMWAQYVVSAGQTSVPISQYLPAHFASSAPRVLYASALVVVLAIPMFAGAVGWATPAPMPGPSTEDDSEVELGVVVAARARLRSVRQPSRQVRRARPPCEH